MAQPKERDRLLDDAGIQGGSPQDRIIGMLLERTEAIRELHDSMRVEFQALITTHSDIKNMVARMVERQENHERVDAAAFASINASHAAMIAKMDNLSTQITTAITEAMVQRAQLSAGWRVILYIGGAIAGAFAIFAIFFNHTW